MQIEKYKTENTVNKLIYTFESVGEKVIKKKVIYSKFIDSQDIGLPPYMNVYNLALGDLDEKTGELDDQVASNNGDMEKVLATVAGTTTNFWNEYPEALIYFEGSQPKGQELLRTYLYQRKINRYFSEISEIANVFGLSDNGWEKLIVNKNYRAFLISQKD